MVLVELILVSGICINSTALPEMGYLHDFIEVLYQFPSAAITKHHTLSGLRRLESYTLGSGRLEVEIKVSAGPGSLRKLYRRTPPCLSSSFW